MPLLLVYALVVLNSGIFCTILLLSRFTPAGSFINCCILLLSLVLFLWLYCSSLTKYFEEAPNSISNQVLITLSFQGKNLLMWLAAHTMSHQKF